MEGSAMLTIEKSTSSMKKVALNRVKATQMFLLAALPNLRCPHSGCMSRCHSSRPIRRSSSSSCASGVRVRRSRSQRSCSFVSTKSSPVTNSPRAARLVNRLQRTDAVGRVVVHVELAEQNVRSVVELDVANGSRLVIDGDLTTAGDIVGRMQDYVVVLDVGVALGRAFVVVERDAGTDDVEDRGAAMREGRLAAAARAACRRRRTSGRRTSRPTRCARPQMSMVAYSLTFPPFCVEPTSAVAENWPLVKP